MPKLETIAGIVLTVIGLIAIYVSWTIQKSDVDPKALTVAFVGIAVSIVGISLIIGDPKQPMDTSRQLP